VSSRAWFFGLLFGVILWTLLIWGGFAAMRGLE
jgi:hypothetical protein